MKQKAVRGLLISAGVVGFAGVSWATAVVLTAPSTTTIQACQGKLTGLLRVVSSPSLCLKDVETPIAWNVQGAAGPAGANGAVGATGPAGPPGVAGPQGVPGAVGPMGPPGPLGVPGTPGSDGAPGVTGAVGPAGPQGSPGAIGPAGPMGPPGVSGGIASVDALQGTSCTFAPGVSGALQVSYTNQVVTLTCSVCGTPAAQCTPGQVQAGTNAGCLGEDFNACGPLCDGLVPNALCFNESRTSNTILLSDPTATEQPSLFVANSTAYLIIDPAYRGVPLQVYHVGDFILPPTVTTDSTGIVPFTVGVQSNDQIIVVFQNEPIADIRFNVRRAT
jgi:Collagen triple helix repeat (20 copies)